MLSVREFAADDPKPKPKDKGVKIFKIWKRWKNRSGKRSLNELYEMALNMLILNRDEKTGLLPIHPNSRVASVYDNVSAALSLWGLSLALSKAGRRTHLEIQKVVKRVMMTMLQGFRHQVIEREETYYKHFPGVDPLVRLDVSTGLPVEESEQVEINQSEDGASKMESVAFFLLTVVQLTAGGLVIVETAEDVSVIQNLVVYLQSVYLRIDTDVDSAKNRIKFEDPTMKISTVAMIKSAIDAFTSMLMSGKQFGLYSVQVFQYEAVQLKHLLKHLINKVLSLKWLHPNVSGIISYPILAIHNPERREEILNAFIGKYQLKEKEENTLYFGRDLMQVYCYLCLSLLFYDRFEEAQEYRILVSQHFCSSHEEFNQMLRRGPGSDSSFTFYTCTSLFITICLISFGYLRPRDIDPLKLSSPIKEKFSSGGEIHVIVLVENRLIQTLLKKNGVDCQLISDLGSNVCVFSDDVLHHFFSSLACNSKENLFLALDKSKHLPPRTPTSYSSSNVFYTSQIYTLMRQNIIFMPRVLEKQSCYLGYDLQMFCDLTVNNLKFLSKNWTLNKTPLYFIPITAHLTGVNSSLPPEMDKLFKKIKSGLLDGIRVKMVRFSRSTDQYYTFNFNLLLSDKSDAKELLNTMSMLSEYNYHGNTDSSSSWKNKRKSNVSRGSLMDSFRFRGSNTTQAHVWNKPSEELKMALSFSGIVGSKDLQTSPSMERLKDILSNWKSLNLNWLPEQIAGFISSTADVPDGQNVPEEECVKLLILYKSSTNFMEKAYTVKRLYNLREYCYLVVRQDGSDESADVDLKKHIM